MFYDFLHSFGAGIAFAIGVFCGATMMAWTAAVYTSKKATESAEQAKRCEDRLEGYVANTERIASVLERLETSLTKQW